MDALLIIDATQDQFPSSPPQPLTDLVARARGVGGVIVHIAPEAITPATAAGEPGGAEPGRGPAAASTPTRPQSPGHRTDDGDEEGDEGEDEASEVPPLQIDSALGTRDDELVLVSAVPDAFEGIDDLAEGLDDLGVDRIIVAGANARDALKQSSFAALAIGFELIVVVDGVSDGIPEGPHPASGATVGVHGSSSGDSPNRSAWISDLETVGAVVKNGADVWLKM